MNQFLVAVAGIAFLAAACGAGGSGSSSAGSPSGNVGPAHVTPVPELGVCNAGQNPLDVQQLALLEDIRKTSQGKNELVCAEVTKSDGTFSRVKVQP